jgi:hypothetical protein
MIVILDSRKALLFKNVIFFFSLHQQQMFLDHFKDKKYNQKPKGPQSPKVLIAIFDIR